MNAHDEAARILDGGNPDLIRLYARDGMRCDQFGCHRISEEARQILVGYVRQADAYARGYYRSHLERNGWGD